MATRAQAVTASLLAVSVASFAPQSVACWWPGQALKRYFGSSETTTAASDTGSPYEGNDVLYNTTYAPTANMVTTPQTQETTGFPLEPLLSPGETEALPPGSRPFDNDSSVPVTVVNAESTPETTETTAQVTTSDLVTTLFGPLFSVDENSVTASGMFGVSAAELYEVIRVIAQETAASREFAALTTAERHMTATTVPATPQTLAPESANGHTSALANEIQFDASTSVTTTGRLSTIPNLADDASALSNEGIFDATANMTTIGQPATAVYADDLTSSLANEATTNLDTSSLPATASTGDDGTDATLFTLTTGKSAPIHPSTAEDAANFVEDAKGDYDAKQTTAPLPGHGSATITTQVTDSTVFLLQTSGDEGQPTTDDSTIATLKGSSYATEASTGQPATATYVDARTSMSATEATTSMTATSVPATVSSGDDDTTATLFKFTATEAAPINLSTVKDLSNLVADPKDDYDANQTTASVLDHGSATITTEVMDFTSGDEVPSTTDGNTVAAVENSSYVTETAMIKTASVSAAGLLDATVTREGLEIASVASNPNNSVSSGAVGAPSVAEPMAGSTTIPTPSPPTRYTEETDQVTSSSASTDTTVTVRPNTAAPLAESTTRLNYTSSREGETNSEGSLTENLGTTAPTFYSQSKVPELFHEDVDDRSTTVAPTSITRRYKPPYVRRFTPWVITRSPSSLGITSTSFLTSSPLTTTRPQVEQVTLKAKESSTVDYVATTHVRRYQEDPASKQGTPVTSTALARIPPSDTLVVPESFFGSRSLFNRFGRPYCPGCDALLIKLPARFSIPLVPPYVYG